MSASDVKESPDRFHGHPSDLPYNYKLHSNLSIFKGREQEISPFVHSKGQECKTFTKATVSGTIPHSEGVKASSANSDILAPSVNKTTLCSNVQANNKTCPLPHKTAGTKQTPDSNKSQTASQST